jgi:hypothetical protein
MTEPIVCHKGKCTYEKKEDFEDECENCNEVEEIEHELIKKEVRGK